jgi:outer membrane protein assembly factor BamB
MTRVAARLGWVSVVLVTLGALALTIRLWPSGNADQHPSPQVEVVWAFEAQQRGAIASTPAVAGDRVFIAAIHSTTFRNAGAVYCLDRATGKPVWRFDDRGAMQHMYSSPTLADGRLYVGEGMHANFTCKLYCLDAGTGKRLWDFAAQGHIESTPAVVEGKVYFSAGDDGIYCLDAATGNRLWQFQGPFHFDTSPAVAAGRVYAGSGVSLTHKTTAAFCLDAASGKPLWRTPTNLPVWAPPAVAGDAVYFGLGNGRLQEAAQPPEKPAGALVCLGAAAGQLRWRFDAEDAVFARATVEAERVYFGSRDGRCYCLEGATGRLRWKRDLGSPVMTSTAYLDGRLYVVSTGGSVCCLEPDRGGVIWEHKVAERTGATPQLYSSPVAVLDAGDERPVRHIYFGSELRTAGGSAAVLYCLRDGAKQP